MAENVLGRFLGGLDYVGKELLGIRPANALFAGASSKDANLNALASARQMVGSGSARDEIWSQTGWYQGPDKKWRYEIDDRAASVPRNVLHALTAARPNSVVVGTPNKAGFHDPAPYSSVLSHPLFFQAYPDAQQPIGGPRNVGVILAKGGSDEGFTKPAITQVPTAERDPDTYRPEQYIELNSKNSKKLPGMALHELQHYIQNVEGFAGGTSPEQAGSFNAYQMSPGELEARVVEWRQHMTPAERAATPPWVTENKVVEALRRNPNRRPRPPRR